MTEDRAEECHAVGGEGVEVCDVGIGREGVVVVVGPSAGFEAGGGESGDVAVVAGREGSC